MLAIVAAVFGAALALVIWWDPDGPIDACLDHGARWDYTDDRCDYDAARSTPDDLVPRSK